MLSREIRGGLDRLHVGLERGIVFMFTGNIFAVNSSAEDVFPVDKTLPSTACTLVTTKDFVKGVIMTVPFHQPLITCLPYASRF